MAGLPGIERGEVTSTPSRSRPMRSSALASSSPTVPTNATGTPTVRPRPPPWPPPLPQRASRRPREAVHRGRAANRCTHPVRSAAAPMETTPFTVRFPAACRRRAAGWPHSTSSTSLAVAHAREVCVGADGQLDPASCSGYPSPMNRGIARDQLPKLRKRQRGRSQVLRRVWRAPERGLPVVQDAANPRAPSSAASARRPSVVRRPRQRPRVRRRSAPVATPAPHRSPSAGSCRCCSQTWSASRRSPPSATLRRSARPSAATSRSPPRW